MTAYADGRGYVTIDQFTPADADRFYAGLKLGPRTKGTRLGVLRAFFRFAVNRKWMPETPVSADIKPPVGSSETSEGRAQQVETVEKLTEHINRMLGTNKVVRETLMELLEAAKTLAEILADDGV